MTSRGRQRLLVTGGTGLLGSVLTSVAAHHYDVTACSKRDSLFIPGARSITLDLCNPASVVKVVSATRPSVVVHCAAETRVDWCEDHPEEALRVNVEGTVGLCRAVALTEGCLVYISTDSVFDGFHGNYTEVDEPGPLNIYARSKWLGEQAVRRNLTDHLIIRTNFYGWGLSPKQSLGEWILERLRLGHRIPGFQDVIFAPLLTDDLADIVLAMIALGLRGTYHLGSRDAISKFDFAKRIARAFGLDQGLVEPVPMKSIQLRAPRPKVTNLNSSKAEEALGFPLPSVDEGVCRFRDLETSGEVAARRALWLSPVLSGTQQRSGARL